MPPTGTGTGAAGVASPRASASDEGKTNGNGNANGMGTGTANGTENGSENGSVKPPTSERSIPRDQVHPNDEQLMRIADILGDAQSICADEVRK